MKRIFCLTLLHVFMHTEARSIPTVKVDL